MAPQTASFVERFIIIVSLFWRVHYRRFHCYSIVHVESKIARAINYIICLLDQVPIDEMYKCHTIYAQN